MLRSIMYGNGLDTNTLNHLIRSETSVIQSEAVPGTPARVKVLDPLTSSGPSMHAELLSFSDADLHLRVPRRILIGSTVQVRTRGRLAFGEVRYSVSAGEQYEIGVVVQRSS